jgi:hypothetical protein
MDSTLFINNLISKINETKEYEFKNNNFKYIEVELPKKVVNDNLMEFRNFKSNLIKRSIRDKSKPSFINKKEYETDPSNVNILEDDVFQFNEESQEKNKLNINEITIEDKQKLINDFLNLKNIKLEEKQINIISQLLADPQFNFKKYITISNTQHQITKIGFLKKMEDGNYLIDLKEKQKNKNIFFK